MKLLVDFPGLPLTVGGMKPAREQILILDYPMDTPLAHRQILVVQPDLHVP